MNRGKSMIGTQIRILIVGTVLANSLQFSGCATRKGGDGSQSTPPSESATLNIGAPGAPSSGQCDDGYTLYSGTCGTYAASGGEPFNFNGCTNNPSNSGAAWTGRVDSCKCTYTPTAGSSCEARGMKDTSSVTNTTQCQPEVTITNMPTSTVGPFGTEAQCVQAVNAACETYCSGTSSPQTHAGDYISCCKKTAVGVQFE